jgi:hypothetical protein
VSHNHINDISDTILARVAADGGFKLDNAIFKKHLDVKDGSIIVLLIVLNVNLLSKISH